LLDLAVPSQPRGLLPAVVFIHGGGWMSADRTNGRPLILLLASHGFAAASIDYRLSDEAGFPSQLEDAKCAVRFMRAHASKYGIDPERIGSAGGSAGGHLAALVGLVPEEAGLEGEGGWETESSRVSAVADLYGISDVAVLLEENPISDCALRLMRGTPKEKPELYRSGSPLEWVRAGAPPFYLTHGDQDNVVPISHSEKLLATLEAVGTEARLRVIPGMAHGSIGTLPEVVREDVVEFFERHLKARNNVALFPPPRIPW
jgi:acetyl esterase/lipase